jgi:predicted nuclease of predicted toxin-antitoxin system
LKLLFDQNLSPRLVGRLADLYPSSAHVREIGLQEAEDLEVWLFAGARGFVIASKDSDFHQLSFLHGPPPKVVWLRVGNGPTRAVEDLLREHHELLRQLESDPEAAFVALGDPAA